MDKRTNQLPLYRQILPHLRLEIQSNTHLSRTVLLRYHGREFDAARPHVQVYMEIILDP